MLYVKSDNGNVNHTEHENGMTRAMMFVSCSSSAVERALWEHAPSL